MYFGVLPYCRLGSSSSSANRWSVNGGCSNSSSIFNSVAFCAAKASKVPTSFANASRTTASRAENVARSTSHGPSQRPDCSAANRRGEPTGHGAVACRWRQGGAVVCLWCAGARHYVTGGEGRGGGARGAAARGGGNSYRCAGPDGAERVVLGHRDDTTVGHGRQQMFH
mmetsp:Transcript_63898/g.176472  ORF Transcript_63898/g.176472 Transcript_63898/m.176472 type:complete len:169 (+) Transcript_63898:381-887(+)